MSKYHGFQRLKFESLFRCLLPLVKIHAPRSEQLVDSLVSSLELNQSHGIWEKEGYCQIPIWNKFLKIVQEVYVWRRDTSSTVMEKRHWNQALANFEIAQRLPISHSYPCRAYIEVTKDCNLRCPMCPQGYEDVNRICLPISTVSKLKQIIPYLELVELFGFGEPLIAPNFYEWIHQWPRSECQTVSTTTNGLLLTPQCINNILSSSVNQLRISVDAVTPETYQWMRGVDGFHQLIGNITHLVQERNCRNRQLEIWIRMVATRRNIHELPEFVRLGHRLGVDFVEVMFLCAYTPDMWKQSLVYDRALCNEMFAKADQVAEELKIPLRLPAYFDLSLTHSEMDKGEFIDSCREPWEFMYITNEQDVRVCCINMITTGNLKTKSFDEIWNSREYQNFRQQLKIENRQCRCKYCFLNYLYADVNNIRSHLIDLKPHFEEVGLGDRLHLPNNSNLESVIANFLKDEGRHVHEVVF